MLSLNELHTLRVFDRDCIWVHLRQVGDYNTVCVSPTPRRLSPVHRFAGPDSHKEKGKDEGRNREPGLALSAWQGDEVWSWVVCVCHRPPAPPHSSRGIICHTRNKHRPPQQRLNLKHLSKNQDLQLVHYKKSIISEYIHIAFPYAQYGWEIVIDCSCSLRRWSKRRVANSSSETCSSHQ